MDEQRPRAGYEHRGEEGVAEVPYEARAELDPVSYYRSDVEGALPEIEPRRR